jgi:hypothetical protein
MLLPPAVRLSVTYWAVLAALRGTAGFLTCTVLLAEAEAA